MNDPACQKTKIEDELKLIFGEAFEKMESVEVKSFDLPLARFRMQFEVDSVDMDRRLDQFNNALAMFNRYNVINPGHNCSAVVFFKRWTV